MAEITGDQQKTARGCSGSLMYSVGRNRRGQCWPVYGIRLRGRAFAAAIAAAYPLLDAGERRRIDAALAEIAAGDDTAAVRRVEALARERRAKRGAK
jgi:hypothetical protein